MSAVVSRVDHVVLETGDEQALFDFFHQTLGLPVAWPMAQWGMIHEGGINIGNCNIGCNHKLDPNSPDEPRIAAVAFEPAGSLGSALRTMDELGLAHTDPMPSGPIDLPHTPWNAGWTNALVFQPTPVSFLCEYAHDVAARRRELTAAFAAQPNPLGITGVEGVWCTTTAFSEWTHVQPTDGPWIGTDDSIGAGAPNDEWWGLYLRVESLERAAENAASLGFPMGTRSRKDGGPWKPVLEHPLVPFLQFVDEPVWG